MTSYIPRGAALILLRLAVDEAISHQEGYYPSWTAEQVLQWTSRGVVLMFEMAAAAEHVPDFPSQCPDKAEREILAKIIQLKQRSDAMYAVAVLDHDAAAGRA